MILLQSVADVARLGNREVEFRLPRARSREGFGGTLTVGAEGVHMTRFRGLERSRVVAPIYPTAPTYRFNSRVCNTERQGRTMTVTLNVQEDSSQKEGR